MSSTVSGGDRNARYFNVKDFGAVGDGLHDDAAAIRAAIEAASEASVPVVIPPGKYRVRPV